MIISLDKVSKTFGSRVLFNDVTMNLPPGHYAITGPNGAGKSTLLKMLTKEEEPTSGKVIVPERIGILSQNIEKFGDFRTVDVVVMGNRRLWDTLQEREELYGQEMTDEIGMRLGDLEGIICEENGYSAESDAEELLAGIGIPREYFTRKMKEMPTDLQFRALLCQALFGDPQALFLDEPTNHLDLSSISWLENFLANYKGILILISHDRHFLNATVNQVADIDYETIILYPGNYDQMVFAKSQTRERVELENKSKEKKVAQLREFVAKFGAGTRASQVQSRIKEIDRLQPQELKKTNIQRPYIRFIPSEKQPGAILITAEGLSKSYSPKEVIKKFSIEINRGDKIGVIGNNGLGKTTLMKLLAGVTEKDRGKLQYGNNVQISYFPQNHSDIVNRSENKTAFDWLKERRPGVGDQEIRSAMGKMLFSGDDAFKKISNLSGGETARLILAGMIISEHNLLLLDEPNGHLDLEAVSALGWGLHEYKGSAVVVSHDRDLIDKVANRIIAFEGDNIVVFNGPLEEYLQRKGTL